MKRFGLILIAGAIALNAAYWYLAPRNVFTLTVELDHEARFLATVRGVYKSGSQHETVEIFSGPVSSGTELRIPLGRRIPWSFVSLEILVEHPGHRSTKKTVFENAHWWSIKDTIKPDPWPMARKTDELVFEDVEEHFQRIGGAYLTSLGQRATAEESWPYFELWFRIIYGVGHESTSDRSGNRQEHRIIVKNLIALEQSLEKKLREAEYLPCEDGSAFKPTDSDNKVPGCGLKPTRFRDSQ